MQLRGNGPIPGLRLRLDGGANTPANTPRDEDALPTPTPSVPLADPDPQDDDDEGVDEDRRLLHSKIQNKLKELKRERKGSRGDVEGAKANKKERSPLFMPLLVAFVLPLLLHAHALPSASAVLSDHALVVRNKDIAGTTPFFSAFSHDASGAPLHSKDAGAYRPLAVLSLRLQFALVSSSPAVSRALNLLLHGACGCVLVLLVDHLLRVVPTPFVFPPAHNRSRVALLAALLFALHPTPVHVLLTASGRAHVLAGLFSLCALFCYTHVSLWHDTTMKAKETGREFVVDAHMFDVRWLLAACVFAALACRCHESAWTLLFALFAFDVAVVCHSRLGVVVRWMAGKKVRGELWVMSLLMRTLALVAVLLATQYYRLSLSAKEAFVDPHTNPAQHAPSALSRYATLLYYTVLNLRAIVFPVPALPADFASSSVPLVTSLADPRNAATAAVWVGVPLVLRALYVRGWGLVYSGLVLMLVPYLAHSGLVWGSDCVVCTPLLYLPCVGFSVAFAFGLYCLGEAYIKADGLVIAARRSLSVVVHFAVLALLLGFASSSWQLGSVYHSDEAIYTHALSVTPNNAFAHHRLALVLSAHTQADSKAEHFARAVDLHPGLCSAWIDYGLMLSRLGNENEALRVWRQGIEATRGSGNGAGRHVLLTNAAGLLRKMGRHNDAEAVMNDQ